MSVGVFITDDHYMVVEGFRTMLLYESNIDWLGHATSAESCLDFLLKQQPDVLFLDINLPDKSGIELCKEIKTLYPAIHVVGLSSFNQQSFIQQMIDHGADGYVLKNATREEIAEAISTVMDGETFLSKEASYTMSQNHDAKNPVITRREKEVLQMIANGLTNHEIADKLYISTTTVDTHRKNLLIKFEAKNTATLMRMAVQLHYIEDVL